MSMPVPVVLTPIGFVLITGGTELLGVDDTDGETYDAPVDIIGDEYVDDDVYVDDVELDDSFTVIPIHRANQRHFHFFNMTMQMGISAIMTSTTMIDTINI